MLCKILINNLQPNVTSVRISHRFGFHISSDFHMGLDSTSIRNFQIWGWIPHGFGFFTWVWNFHMGSDFTSIRNFHMGLDFSHG